jgi:hypothetical protein
LEQRPFVIRFEIWLVKAKKTLTMHAVAQPDEANHCYLIHSFSNSLKTYIDQTVYSKLTLPYISVQLLERDGKNIWIHTRSGKETAVSTSIGKAIEQQDQALYSNQYHVNWKQGKTGS